MARKLETPFHKITTVGSKLDLFTKFGDAALAGQPIGDFISDVRECFEYLMTFRNIINRMVAFDQPPERAVLPYLSDDVIEGEK